MSEKQPQSSLVNPYLMLLLALCLLVLSACSRPQETPAATCQPTAAPTSTPTRTPRPSLTPTPTATPTPRPPGAEDMPFKMGVVLSPIDQNALAASGVLSQYLFEQTGLAFQVEYYERYEDLLHDLGDYSLHAAWLPPLTYVYAQQEDLAEANLLVNHYGTYAIGVQFLAPSSTGAQVSFNAEKNINTANAATALRQFQGKTPCWVSRTSASGYVVPAAILAQNSIPVQPGAMLQSHSAVIRALYAGGICDFGATFSISGDPRTAPDLLAEYPDILEEMPIVWRSDPIIPNLNLSYHPFIQDDLRSTINVALFNYISSPEGQQTLSDTLQYHVQDLKWVEDDLYQPLTELLEILGEDLEIFIGG
ncbi:MAG: PhnD/SsuA/transferrin family substrate-binding protein [Chloroflexi bacterium]|nr:PhnD/SsuA/transferrin family substrate-binding protein [Chloroflexota bacterium]